MAKKCPGWDKDTDKCKWHGCVSVSLKEYTVVPKEQVIWLSPSSGKFEDIEDGVKNTWVNKYPDVDVLTVIKETADYWLTQPRQKWKKDWKRAIENQFVWSKRNGKNLRTISKKTTTPKKFLLICDRCGKKYDPDSHCLCSKQEIPESALVSRNILGGVIVVDKKPAI